MRRTISVAAAMSALLAVTPGGLSAQVSGAALPDSVREALSGFGLSREGLEAGGRLGRGHVVVERADTVRGAVVAVNGSLDVYGHVTGGAFALWGDVVVHEGAEVLGGAGALRGRVIVDGGRVRGDLQAWRPPSGPVPAEPAPALTAGYSLRLALGWTVMLLVVGLLVLAFAAPNLESAARMLEHGFGRTLVAGVIGQLGFLPALLLALVALAVTILGILLIPFALVAAPLALAGFVALGWLALALVTGRALTRSGSGAGTRQESVRALIVGVLVLMLPWFIASASVGTGPLGTVAQIVAIGVTWVAMTAGFGATLLTRAGTARTERRAATPQVHGWQTPTPIGGVAAARRPIPARPGAAPK